jgi:putative endonuclease
MPGSETSKFIMFYNYVIEGSNGELYYGFSNNLRRRIEEHNKGLNTSTKPYRPWKLIYYEACLDMEDAKRREGYMKTTQGRRLIKLRLKNYFYNKKK